MRKYIVGCAAGIILGVSATAYADDIQSLIGHKVQGQAAVYLDGAELDTAIIVDGKSYAPTRKIAEATGKSVTFNEGSIYMETPAPEKEPTVVNTMPDRIKEIGYQLDALKEQKDILQVGHLNFAEVLPEETVKELTAQMAEIDAKIAALESEKAELEQ